MNILYKQSASSCGALSALEISDCYYKHLVVEKDRNNVTKPHHHTCFELHIVTKGNQLYEVNGDQYSLNPGQLLLIYPNITHKVICSASQTEKISITFRMELQVPTACYYGSVFDHLCDSIIFITEESAKNKERSQLLIENRIAEMIISVLRLSGLQERAAPEIQCKNTALSLAEQYITDNLTRAPSVSEVSHYCYLSRKHLTRIFYTAYGISPGEYIRKERIKYIEFLLSDSNLTLKQISETMNFSSEYYLSVFFKKEAGMPPGAYRKMIDKRL